MEESIDSLLDKPMDMDHKRSSKSSFGKKSNTESDVEKAEIQGIMKGSPKIKQKIDFPKISDA